MRKILKALLFVFPVLVILEGCASARHWLSCSCGPNCACPKDAPCGGLGRYR